MHSGAVLLLLSCWIATTTAGIRSIKPIKSNINNYNGTCVNNVVSTATPTNILPENQFVIPVNGTLKQSAQIRMWGGGGGSTPGSLGGAGSYLFLQLYNVTNGTILTVNPAGGGKAAGSGGSHYGGTGGTGNYANGAGGGGSSYVEIANVVIAIAAGGGGAGAGLYTNASLFSYGGAGGCTMGENVITSNVAPDYQCASIIYGGNQTAAGYGAYGPAGSRCDTFGTAGIVPYGGGIGASGLGYGAGGGGSGFTGGGGGMSDSIDLNKNAVGGAGGSSQNCSGFYAGNALYGSGSCSTKLCYGAPAQTITGSNTTAIPFTADAYYTAGTGQGGYSGADGGDGLIVVLTCPAGMLGDGCFCYNAPAPSSGVMRMSSVSAMLSFLLLVVVTRMS